MATHKRSRSDTEDASRLSSTADDDPFTTPLTSAEFAIANERARKAAPIEKVIGIVELGEQVLSHLPMYDLLRAMQVCRTLKETIDNSHQLQKTLFLVPDLIRPKLAISTSGTLLSGTRAAQHIAATQAAGERETGEFTCCVLHPALQLSLKSLGALRVVMKYEGMVKYAAHRFHSWRFLTSDSVVVCGFVWSSTEKGSKPSGLDNMLVTQPPVTSLRIVTPGFDHYSCCAADKTVGVTFGDVFKTIKRTEKSYWFRDCHRWWIRFDRQTFVVNAEARAAVERAEELSSEDDPTRWVLKDGEHVLKEGGFEFV